MPTPPLRDRRSPARYRRDVRIIHLSRLLISLATAPPRVVPKAPPAHPRHLIRLPTYAPAPAAPTQTPTTRTSRPGLRTHAIRARLPIPVVLTCPRPKRVLSALCRRATTSPTQQI